MAFIILAFSVQADAFYVSPPGETAAGQWASVSAVLQSGAVRGGDEILLLPGQHGLINVQEASFDVPIRVRPALSGTVQISGLEVSESRNLTFEDLILYNDGVGEGHLIWTSASTSKITFARLQVHGRPEARAYRSWSRREWLEEVRPGLLLRGHDSAVVDSQFIGVSGGIGVLGERARIEGNQIRGFVHDGIQIAGNAALVRSNHIEDCIKVDENHNDGIQAWSRGPDGRPGRGVLKGLVIEGNFIVEWRGLTVAGHTCSLQGIGLFDGIFRNLEIRNNIIAASAPHGIAAAGVDGGVIVNNTIVQNRETGSQFPWIGVFDHRDGRRSANVIVANNIAPDYRIPEGDGIIQSQNLIERYPTRRLEAPSQGNFTPRINSGLIGTADAQYAPASDAVGRSRGDGSGPDLGAIERH
jgi:hypothetical protein